MNSARWWLVVAWVALVALTIAFLTIDSQLVTPFLIAVMLLVGLFETHVSPAGGWLAFVGRNRWMKVWMSVYVACLIGFLIYALTTGFRIADLGMWFPLLAILGLLGPSIVVQQLELFRRFGRSPN